MLFVPFLLLAQLVLLVICTLDQSNYPAPTGELAMQRQRVKVVLLMISMAITAVAIVVTSTGLSMK